MAMTLRVVLNKAVGRQLKGGKLGFLGAISSGCQHSIVGHNSSRSNNNNDTHLPSSNCWCRHYYFLPSPPAVRVLDFPTVAGVRRVHDAETDDRVRKLGEFAVKARNQGSAQDGVDGGVEIQFVRPVRASFKLSMGLIYYITLEALRGKADMNVYYAEVLDCPDQNLLKLIKWEQVNESFSYPFEEIRLSKFLEKKYRRERAAAKNYLVSTLLEELELRCRIPEGAKYSEAKFQQNWGPGMLNIDDGPPTPPETFYLWATFTLGIVPVFDIKTYEMVYEYAMFAIGAQFKNEDERVHLKDVLWASKSKDNNGWVYHIVLEAINGKSELDFYYAIVKASPMRQLELIKWHQIGESLRCPDEEEEKRFDEPNYEPPPILAETPEIYD
nr:uncharacterized protein LOC113730560 isoform X2 [Coffea arabica]